MADEIPPAPSESPDDVTKSETIRITLPPKSEQPAVKRETVRINVPGKPVPPAGTAPKKETTKLPSGAAATPPAPKPLPTAPLPAAKPLSGITPPKPPTLGQRPTVPLKPSPAAPTSAAPAPEPVTQKGAAPKKETARITLPPEGAKPPLPKATVKMQPTQQLSPRPSSIQAAPSIKTTASTIQSAPLTTAAASADKLIGPLSVVMLLVSLALAALAYLGYSATAAV